MNPPESRCGVAVCAARPSRALDECRKIGRGAFAQPSGAACSSDRANSACAMLDSGIRCARRRAPSLRRSTGASLARA